MQHQVCFLRNSQSESKILNQSEGTMYTADHKDWIKLTTAMLKNTLVSRKQRLQASAQLYFKNKLGLSFGRNTEITGRMRLSMSRKFTTEENNK